ncbi:MAG: ABC transporter ATP-binding protein [Marinilabiliaceae bacterium]|nr:ABC transporter ATP-binding protein [Marinilabiliaceae bacterium]
MNIEIRNIDFAYNGENVLSNLSTIVNKGDFIALVGPNGSGKSTFIKCLNKILIPQKGVITLNNINIANIPLKDLAKEITYVPQNEQKSLGLNVFDYIITGRKPYINWRPSGNDIINVAQIIKKLHLDDIAMKDVNNLSGGQKQLVSIARALVQEPEILLLDEPTASLDIKHQIEIMELLKTISAKGVSVVIAMHDINIAIKYANKFIMLKNKSVFAEGGKDIINKENIEGLYEIKVNLIKQNNNLYIFPDGLH